MSCIACRLLRQYAVNWLNVADHAFNAALLGDADETFSARTARARRDGARWAGVVCRLLTGAARVFGQTRDHCDYALDPTVLPNTAEIFDLTTMRLRVRPVGEVDVVESQAP